MISHRDITALQDTIWDYYSRHGRNLPWREEPFEPYRILVSEMMLQQTQVPRVIPKYENFLTTFPTLASLADAELGAVLQQWNGLGYNRRAKYLHDAAKQLTAQTGDWTIESLTACKGVGPNTAAAIYVYAYNRPALFIETNIRTVFIHHFFSGQESVGDDEIMSYLEAVLDTEHPRDFYYGLMDYGSFLKKEFGNLARNSSLYMKQSRFQGSKRQLRGAVLRLLTEGRQTHGGLSSQMNDERLGEVIAALLQEGLIREDDGYYSL